MAKDETMRSVPRDLEKIFKAIVIPIDVDNNGTLDKAEVL